MLVYWAHICACRLTLSAWLLELATRLPLAWTYDRVELPPIVEAFEDVRTTILEAEVGAHYKILCRPRGQDLARLGLVHDPGGKVYRQTPDIVASHLDLARVDPHPDLDPASPTRRSNSAVARIALPGRSNVAMKPSPVILTSLRHEQLPPRLRTHRGRPEERASGGRPAPRRGESTRRYR